MKFKNSINSAFRIPPRQSRNAGLSGPLPPKAATGHSVFIFCLTFLVGLGIAGCRTASVVRPEKPLEIVFFVQADKSHWQDAGIIVKRGQIVHCVAKGKWSDANGTYGPKGNPKITKDHLGLSAPAKIGRAHV